MRRVVLRACAAFMLGLSMIALPAIAEDSPSMKDPPPKAPTFPGYVYVTDVFGEVVSANDKSVKLRVTWYETQRGGSGRSSLSRGSRYFRNPFIPNMNRPRQANVKIVEKHEDYDLEFLPESLVRVKKLPPRKDEKAQPLEYSQKEHNQLRLPLGVVGFSANTSDLVPGTIVEVILIRDKTISAGYATEKDLRIKYAIIWGKDPHPARDIIDSSNNTKSSKSSKQKKN